MRSLIGAITDQSLYNDDEVLYVSKSKKLIKCLKDIDLDVLYDPILNAGKPSKLETVGKQLGDRIKRAKSIMVAYCLSDDKCADPQMRDVVLEGISDFKINARELVIYPFMGQFKSHFRSVSSRTMTTGASHQVDIMPEDNIDSDISMRLRRFKSVGKSSYMSTPYFIKYLTNVSQTIMKSDNKLETLHSELRQLNLKLPATVYIPFVSGNVSS